jgi:hypothetical protein
MDVVQSEHPQHRTSNAERRIRTERDFQVASHPNVAGCQLLWRFCIPAMKRDESRAPPFAKASARQAGRGGQVANIACARKIALLFYNAIKLGIKYVEEGLEAYEKRYREQSINRIKKAASIFGYRLESNAVA